MANCRKLISCRVFGAGSALSAWNVSSKWWQPRQAKVCPGSSPAETNSAIAVADTSIRQCPQCWQDLMSSKSARWHYPENCSSISLTTKFCLRCKPDVPGADVVWALRRAAFLLSASAANACLHFLPGPAQGRELPVASGRSRPIPDSGPRLRKRRRERSADAHLRLTEAGINYR